MSILLKNYLREHRSESMCCTFYNDKKIYFNEINNNNADIEMDEDMEDLDDIKSLKIDLIATFDYSNWNVEIYKNYYICYYKSLTNYYYFIIKRDKIFFQGNFEIVFDRKANEIIGNKSKRILNDKDFIIPNCFFRVKKIDETIYFYYKDLLILSQNDKSIHFEDLELVFKKSVNGFFFLRYSNPLVNEDSIEIYNNLFSLDYTIVSKNCDPHLIISYPYKNACRILCDEKEEYYLVSNQEKNKSIAIANISFDVLNDGDNNFVFSLGFSNNIIRDNSDIILNKFKYFQKFDLRDGKITLRNLNNLQINLPHIDCVKLSNADNKMEELINQLTISSEINLDTIWNDIKKSIKDNKSDTDTNIDIERVIVIEGFFFMPI